MPIRVAKAVSNSDLIQSKRSDYAVTVGAGGDFATLGEAIAHLSKYKTIYSSGSYSLEARILSGTTISEQIIIEREDLSAIIITSVDAFVNVNATGWVETLDSRGSKPMFSGQYGARLPAIGTLFKRTAGDLSMGYFANRGSTGVICGSDQMGKACGFDGFYDCILANNNSEIVARYGTAKNAGRWGVHARHISRISARSCNLTSCALAAYADRCSMLDVREADMSGSVVAINALHASTITANGAHADNLSTSNYAFVCSDGSTLNCSAMTIGNPSSSLFQVLNGGTITVFAAVIDGMAFGQNLFSQTKNAIVQNGIIYSDVADISLTTFADIQTAVRAGTISSNFSVGDQVAVTHSVYGTLIFDVIGLDIDTPTNGEYTHSLTLQLHTLPHDGLAFDAIENAYGLTADTLCVAGRAYYSKSGEVYTLLTENVDWTAGTAVGEYYQLNATARSTNGYGRWSQSAMRQWLNSDAAANAWWSAQNIWDVAPTHAATTAGFLNGLDADFLAVIGTVTKRTAKAIADGGGYDDTVDKMFLLSITEVDLGLSNSVSEGTVYTYYSGQGDTGRIKYKGTDALTHWLRSPYPTDASNAGIITANGTFSASSAKSTIRYAPACVIW